MRAAACWAAAADADPPPCELRGTPPDARLDSANHPTFEREHRTAAERHQQSPSFHELLNLRQSLPTDSTGDVVGFSGGAEAGTFGFS